MDVLGKRCAALPDKRSGRNTRYAMRDIGLAAFSVFFVQSPSFLAHQRLLSAQRGASNAGTLFGMERVPCDSHIRRMLDGAPTDHFDVVFSALVDDLDGAGALSGLRCLDDRVLIALDGSEPFRSGTIHCAHCSTRRRGEEVSISTALSAPLWWRRGSAAPCLWRRSSCARKTARRSRTARAARRSAGWPAWGLVWPG